jgi:hypothetical protein
MMEKQKEPPLSIRILMTNKTCYHKWKVTTMKIYGKMENNPNVMKGFFLSSTFFLQLIRHKCRLLVNSTTFF